MAADPDVADSLFKIRQYHALGSRVRDTKYGEMEGEAERLGLNIHYMRAARRFAAMYSPEQLDRLCKACETANYPLGWARTMLLLTVPKAAERESLLKQAIREDWSKPKLQAEIRRRYGVRRKPGAGRPTKLDAEDSPEAAYSKGLEICQKFNSFMSAMRRESDDGKTLLGRMPASTRKCIERAETKMEALQRALSPKVTGVPSKRIASGSRRFETRT
jgi:hypothetical protein